MYATNSILAVALLAIGFDTSIPAQAVTPTSDPTSTAPLDRILAPVHRKTKKWATVVRVTHPDTKPEFRWFHLRDSQDAVDFWPASTIKLYTAVAALEWLNRESLPVESTITFFRRPPNDTDSKWVRDCARTVPEMISEIFRRSSNEDYTLLLRMVGIDVINTRFLIPEKGFPHSALMRDYVTYRPVLYVNEEPQRIEVQFGDQPPRSFEHTWSGISYAKQRGATILSSTTGNCTSTRELADCLRRVLFHAKLPEAERYAITAKQAEWLTHGDPARGVVGLENRSAGAYGWKDTGSKAFPDARYFHKSGLISTYSLDVCYLTDRGSDTHLILALAARSGNPEVVRDMASAIYRAAADLR